MVRQTVDRGQVHRCLTGGAQLSSYRCGPQWGGEGLWCFRLFVQDNRSGVGVAAGELHPGSDQITWDTPSWDSNLDSCATPRLFAGPIFCGETRDGGKRPRLAHREAWGLSGLGNTSWRRTWSLRRMNAEPERGQVPKQAYRPEAVPAWKYKPWSIFKFSKSKDCINGRPRLRTRG